MGPGPLLGRSVYVRACSVLGVASPSAPQGLVGSLSQAPSQPGIRWPYPQFSAPREMLPRWTLGQLPPRPLPRPSGCLHRLGLSP